LILCLLYGSLATRHSANADSLQVSESGKKVFTTRPTISLTMVALSPANATNLLAASLATTLTALAIAKASC